MSTRLFHDAQQWELDDGLPNAGGKIYFYEPGTTTLKAVYTTSSLTTAHTNPVILDANGRPTDPIWLNGEYKYKTTTSGDVAVGLTIDNLNADTATAVTESGLLISNGSFEVDTGDDGTPDSWTLSALTAATIAVDTTDSAHGTNSLKFTSGGNGGGTATSTRFDVLKSEDIIVEWTYKASSATVLTKIDILTYNKDGVIVSPLNAYTAATGNPTSYTTFQRSVTADATAVTAEVVVTGIDAASTTKTNGTTTNIDDISVVIKSTRFYTEQLYADDIRDANDNELATFVTTASAVNNPRITNAATGNSAKIDVTETNSGLEVDANGSGVLDLAKTSTGAVNVRSVPIYGLVIADTPVVVLTDTTTNATAQTAVDITTFRETIQTAQSIGDVVAQKAILNVQLDIAPNAAIATAEVMVGEGGETLTNGVHRAVEVGTNNDGGPFSESNFITVNLAAGEIFDYKITQAGTAPTSRTVKIYLAGWHV